ncbi:YjbQ family protein [Xenorhabdus sp. XENO-10]|uniref:YjbQ family protein n=1 Tax=Xenorhabdus yunnanensis TaxID=3025878 RepID=A0ABT5LEY2_9GAMM|nr:YjbQ family protein [Xenorhabdus yunnanensis]MDC9589524.1 YjbQ family protein [Xenorhabdus yunnanensis]
MCQKSGVKNGLVNVFSQHTSCSVFIQEDSEDVTYWKIPLILQDTLNILEKIIPTCQHEGQYLHPGPVHTKNAAELRGEKSEWMLNTDGHLRSVLLGRSETIPLLEGDMTLGEFGRIYFSDMDQTRARNRRVRGLVIGE